MPDPRALELPTTRPSHDPRAGPPSPAARRRHRLVSIGGGKGGIGKSLVATHLAAELARRGERVVLVDADLGGANLHTCLAVPVPKRTLSDFVARRVDRIEDVITPTGVPNLGLVSGALDDLDAANPHHAQKLRIVRALQSIDADHVIVDLGAGTHLTVIDFFLVCDHGVLVLVPEPTAVENAYRFVRTAFWRRVRNVAATHGLDAELDLAVRAGGATRSPAEVLAELAQRAPDAARLVSQGLRAFRPRLVVNAARTAQDRGMGRSVVGAWRKFVGLEMDELGTVPHDEGLWQRARARKGILTQDPDAPLARSFAAIADRLLALEGGGAAAGAP